ncbi:MAG: transposase [Bacteroidetes bacterium]|nr:transposase [Bacteroidota bacterium]
MIKRAGKHGIVADYLLVDSWFVCDELVKFVAQSKMVGHLVGQCKNDKRKYLYKGLEYSGAALKKLLGAKWTRCRTLKMQYIQVDVAYKGTPLRLFFTRRHGNTSERLLLTTDQSLSFTKAFDIYAIRWTIEVYFKESKQLLGLGNCQSRDFDAQIAAVTICMMQYLTLAHQKRIGSYHTIGGLFRECTTGHQGATEPTHPGAHEAASAGNRAGLQHRPRRNHGKATQRRPVQQQADNHPVRTDLRRPSRQLGKHNIR